MRKFVVYLLVLSLFGLLFCGCGPDEPILSSETASVPTLTEPDHSLTTEIADHTAETIPSSEAPTVEPTAETPPEDALFVIETEYAALKYPGKWKDRVTVTPEGNVVRFSNGNTALFDIVFDGTEGVLIGTIQGEDKNTVVRMIYHEIDENVEHYEDCCSMQEDVNVVVEGLKTDYDFAAGKEIIKEDDSVFAIETPVVTLYYPNKWKDTAEITVEEDGVHFACDGTALFGILFNRPETVALGRCRGTEIGLSLEELDPDLFPEETYDVLCAMQEDVNVVIQHLQADETFEPISN